MTKQMKQAGLGCVQPADHALVTSVQGARVDEAQPMGHVAAQRGGAAARIDTGRRRWLLAGGGAMLLAGCGDVLDRDRIIVDDLEDGAEIRLNLHQELEVRLAINPADGHVTFLRSRIAPELQYRSGPVYRDRDPRRPTRGLPIEEWVFTGREPGNTTIRLEYARQGDSRPARVITYRVDVLPWY
ncbi:MAG: protease inhibitor I42 family protein [Lautropia sp.]|nr:protease inhibitor I42 family protein [Lautropia sp.]